MCGKRDEINSGSVSVKDRTWLVSGEWKASAEISPNCTFTGRVLLVSASSTLDSTQLNQALFAIHSPPDTLFTTTTITNRPSSSYRRRLPVAASPNPLLSPRDFSLGMIFFAAIIAYVPTTRPHLTWLRNGGQTDRQEEWKWRESCWLLLSFLS